MKLVDHVDLKDLEHKARKVAVDGDADWMCPDPSNLATDEEKAFIEAMSPAVTLALIARIGDLERALREAVSGIGLLEPHTEAEVREDAALIDRCLAIVERGAVLS
jgi:hypothetical protein